MDDSQDDVLWNDGHSDAAASNDEESDADDDLYYTDAELPGCFTQQLEQALELFMGDDDDDEFDGVEASEQ